RRRHARFSRDWSSDVCSSDLAGELEGRGLRVVRHRLANRPPDDHPMDEPVEGVVVIPPADLVDEDLVLTVAEVSRSLPDGPRLYVATQRAVSVKDGEQGEPGQGFVSALTRVLAFERTVQRATHVDVDRPADLVAELLAGDDAREVAWRGGARYAARLARAALPEPAGKPAKAVRRGAAYVITGGYGGIGLVTARLLAERGAGRIVLSGRKGPDADAEKVIARLREDGVDVGVVLGDIAEPGTAERLVRVAQEGGVPLRGVVHGAGVIDDRLIADLGADDLHRVWTAKVEGARRLSEATWDLDLDWFVMHSSAAALLARPGRLRRRQRGDRRADGVPAGARAPRNHRQLGHLVAGRRGRRHVGDGHRPDQPGGGRGGAGGAARARQARDGRAALRPRHGGRAVPRDPGHAVLRGADGGGGRAGNGRRGRLARRRGAEGPRPRRRPQADRRAGQVPDRERPRVRPGPPRPGRAAHRPRPRLARRGADQERGRARPRADRPRVGAAAGRQRQRVRGVGGRGAGAVGRAGALL